MIMKDETPKKIKIRGARVHNLKNIDVDIPLNEIVGIAGAWRAVCRRFQALSGVSVNLYKTTDDSGGKSGCG